MSNVNSMLKFGNILQDKAKCAIKIYIITRTCQFMSITYYKVKADILQASDDNAYLNCAIFVDLNIF